MLAQGKPLDQEFNQAVEELISFIMKTQQDGRPREGAEDRAVVYAEAHVSSLEAQTQAPSADKQPEERRREELILGDAMARLASLRFRRDPPASEDLMARTLAIRERCIGPESHGVAITLVALAEMREVQRKVDGETERLLLRAHAIFDKLGDKGSEHCPRIAAKIERLRALREGRMPPVEDDPMFDEVEESLGLREGSSGKPAAKGLVAKGKRTAPPVPDFRAGDGLARSEWAVRLLKQDFVEEACPIGACVCVCLRGGGRVWVCVACCLAASLPIFSLGSSPLSLSLSLPCPPCPLCLPPRSPGSIGDLLSAVRRRARAREA